MGFFVHHPQKNLTSLRKFSRMESVITNDLFYSRLPVNQIPLGDLLGEEHLFYKVPDNWHVLITDVKKSTGAVESGLHETVNLVATGSIEAVLNLAFKATITVP